MRPDAYAHSLFDDGTDHGLMLPPFVPPENLSAVPEALRVREDDVFIVTYPKSGTTWMEQIAWLLTRDGEQGAVPLGTAVPWVETLPQRPGGIRAFLDAMPGRRLFNSHLPVALMPGMNGNAGRYIYVIRNPADVAVSFFHHDRSKNDYEGSWDQYFERFLVGAVHFGRVFDHVAGWWAAAKADPRILIVSYESMKRDTRAIAERISTFLDVDADTGLLDTVVAGSQFDAMASNPKTDLHWVPQRSGRPGHYRRGVVGDWASHFHGNQRARLDDAMRGALPEGPTFDFGSPKPT
jgi:hypothetical protein